MKRLIGGTAMLGLMSLLAACSEAEEPQANLTTQDVNEISNLDDLPAPPAANAAIETPAADTQSEPAAKPAAPKTAPAKPAPAKPKAPQPAPKADASDPACLPEHRAAGHC